jgi:hypothetical protein
MRYWKLAVSLVAAGFAAESCGGKSRGPALTDAGLADAGLAAQDAGRAPKEHRVGRVACPTERGIVTPSSDGCPVDAGSGRCAQDSDCTAGRNGRCESIGICPSDCTYDECVQDSDCANQTPCGCRLNATDFTRCFGASNCATDADCGIGGYCSPSLVVRACLCIGNACAEGYFCHTQRDGCLDDSDCENSSACVFDPVEKRFSCQECYTRP